MQSTVQPTGRICEKNNKLCCSRDVLNNARLGLFVAARDLNIGEMLQRLDQCVIALTPHSLRLQRSIEVEDEAGRQERDAQLIGSLEGEAQVFLLQVDGKTGSPVALDHLRTTIT